MILDEVYKETFKVINNPGSQRKYIRHVGFIRDPRTGLHGLLVLKNDEYQFYSISNYADSFSASLNQAKSIFTAPITDISQFGRGNELCVLVTTTLSKVYYFQFDNEIEQFTSTVLNLSNAIFTRLLPNRTLIVATNDGKLAKYSIEGHLQTLVEIPSCPLPRCMAISQNGKNAAIGDRSGKLHVFDLDSMEVLHSVDTQSGELTCIEFSQDGNQILVGSKQPVIKLFTYEDLGTLVPVRSFMHHSDAINSIITLGANIERFVTSSSDGNICIWEMTRDEPVHVIKLKDEFATTINFSPDGYYLVAGTDEGNIRVFRTPFTSDYSEPQYFIDEHPLNLFNDEAEGLIFLKMEANPNLKLREAFHQVADARTERVEAQNAALRQLRKARRRQRRVIAHQSRVEQMRLIAAREGRDFVPPETPPFSDDNDDNLDELSDIDEMFNRIQPPRAEEVQETENKEEFGDLFNSPLSSPASNAEQQSPKQQDSDNEEPTHKISGLDLLSDSDEEQKPYKHENDSDSPPKSPISESNENANEAKSPPQGQLWDSDEEDQQVEQRKTPQSVDSNAQYAQRESAELKSPVNEDVDMEDLTEERHVEQHRTPASNASSTKAKSYSSSPPASPPNQSP
ncbi:Protein HIR [Aphelenchoides bicaudatus]|nr:Protein HIR [Aphelenchoides bicaudatus]